MTISSIQIHRLKNTHGLHVHCLPEQSFAEVIPSSRRFTGAIILPSAPNFILAIRGRQKPVADSDFAPSQQESEPARIFYGISRFDLSKNTYVIDVGAPQPERR